MTTKDHYKTLEISYTANADTIRSAFRKLAFTHHPDKNEGDKRAEEKFKEIQEAYFILSDTKRRAAYHLKSGYPLNSKQQAPIPVTADSLLQECQKLNLQITQMDIFRMSQQALFGQIMELLSFKNILIIQQLQKDKVTQKIIHELLQCSRPLAYSYTAQINVRLLTLAGSNSLAIDLINTATKQKKRLSYWERYNGLIILFATLLLCLLIWLFN